MRRAFSRTIALLAALAWAGAAAALSGCGQSGPLYLPPPKPQPAPRTAAPPARTAPAPGPATR